MTDTSVATPERRRTPQPGPRKGEGGPRKRIERRLAIALKAIVHQGQELVEAAATAGMTAPAVRLALERPHVIAFMKQQREILRQYVSAQNIHHARRMRNESENEMARLGAMKYIDSVDIKQAAANAGQSAGFVIVVNNNITAAPIGHERDVTPKPLITHDRDFLDENVDR